MASWGLRCPNCSQTFVHSEIKDTVANQFWPARPKFPEGGQAFTCTNCGKESLFQQNDITYQKGSFKRGASS
jgi:DNA-directed RNA polymerase subunit RPC12/RpoP